MSKDHGWLYVSVSIHSWSSGLRPPASCAASCGGPRGMRFLHGRKTGKSSFNQQCWLFFTNNVGCSMVFLIRVWKHANKPSQWLPRPARWHRRPLRWHLLPWERRVWRPGKTWRTTRKTSSEQVWRCGLNGFNLHNSSRIWDLMLATNTSWRYARVESLAWFHDQQPLPKIPWRRISLTREIWYPVRS